MPTFQAENAGRSLIAYARNLADGQVSYRQTQFDDLGGVDGLSSIRSVAATPDGHHLYTAAFDADAVSIFGRSPDNGQLVYLSSIFDGRDDVEGLNGAWGVAGAIRFP
jgi:hypothetical protein